jgi:uncharacterized protein
MEQDEIVISKTKQWVIDVVIGCNFCPFAKREVVQRNSVHYQVENSTEIENCLEAFINECKRLDDDASIETILLIFPHAFKDFEEYLSMLELAEQLLEEEGYEGVYQVASFHPEYRFEGAPLNDPANYTNRSIYPMLHLLREESLEGALDHYPGDPEEIPERNIKFARDKGLEYMKMLVQSIL